MIENLIIIIFFIVALAFIFIMNERRDKSEKDRFREFVRAIKARDAKEYEEILPMEIEEKEMVIEDELIPLEEVDPEQLLTTRK